MQKLYYRLVLRRDRKRADGTMPLILQAFVNGARVRLPTGIFLQEDDYDPIRMMAKGRAERNNKINMLISSIRSKVDNIFFEAMINDDPLSLSQFEQHFTTKTVLGDFIAFMDAEIEREKQDKKASTIRNYQTTIKALKEFRKTISFADLNFEFVQDFDRWLKSKKKVDQNTAAKYHRVLRKFVLIAKKKRSRVKNPYEEFKIREVQTQRNYLNAQEVQRLQELYATHSIKPHLQVTLRHFLFQIATSLRYSDLKQVCKSDIVDDLLIFAPVKTTRYGKVVRVPLGEMALAMLKDSESAGPNLFQVPAEQIMNRRLKGIGDIAGVGKLSTHVARHTYGYLFIAAGGSVEVLQQIMGHSDLKTTMIYTHIDASQIRAGVKALDAFLRVRE